MQKCTKCLEKKPLSDFYTDTKRPHWFRYDCKICVRKKIREYRDKTKNTISWMVAKIYSSQRSSSKRRNHPMPEYSSKELLVWIKKQDNFDFLYNNWIKSKYDMMMKPSIDRTNNNIWYSFDNIRLVSWWENYKNLWDDMRKWVIKNISKPQKSVQQIDIKTGKILRIFVSLNEAFRVTGVDNSCISKCCNWKFSQSWWFIWKFNSKKCKE